MKPKPPRKDFSVHNLTDTFRFLQEIFPDFSSRAIFANLNPADHTRNYAGLDPLRDCYWSIAAFPDDTSAVRTLARAVEVRALVIDDVGTKVPSGNVKMGLGTPTAVVETSAGNFQWVYRLATPVAVGAWGRFVGQVEGLIGARLEGRDAVHLFRLPMGINSKPGRAKFAVRLVELNGGRSLDGNTLTVGGSGPGLVSVFPTAGGSGASGPGPRVKDIGGLVALLPNDTGVDREGWTTRAHQIKALALDEEAGWEAFEAWSERWTGGAYDAAATRKMWDSIRGTRTSGLELLAEAETENWDGFARVMNGEARRVFDDDAVAPRVPPGPGAVQFKRGMKKEILKSMDNAKRALTGLGVVCRHDEFHHRVYIGLKQWSDHALLLLRNDLIGVYGVDFGTVNVLDAVLSLALGNGFNPVREMLEAAELFWDGTLRLDRLGPDYFYSEDTALARACFRKVMIAAVRRARAPGCKFDQILVMESPEGWEKSTAWEVLAGDGNFSDAKILGRDARGVQEELGDIWIHEIADLSGLGRADIEEVKAFASRTNDRARPVYGRALIDQPRQSIEVGTTNADAYLLSQTGNRRFWPFKLSAPVDTARLRLERLQLWGEAAAAESAGETLVLDRALWGAAGDEQEKRRVVDTLEDELDGLVEMPAGAIAPIGWERIEVRPQGDQFISNMSLNAFLKDDRKITLYPGIGRRIAETMRRLGWERCMVKINGKAARGYKRARPTSNVASVAAIVTKKTF